MGLTIALQDESGNRIKEVYDPTNILHKLLPSYDDRTYQCLRFIDWYGDTVFNYLQMESFLTEWNRIREAEKSHEERELLSQIEDLARRVQNERLYLKFIGD